MRPTQPQTICSLAVLLAAWSTTAALASQDGAAPATPAPSTLPPVEDPATIAPAANPEQDLQDALRDYRSRQKQLETELRRIRHTYFRNPRAQDLRAAGIEKLKQYNDPAIFEPMIEIFARSGDDVVQAIIDHLATLQTPEALATIAWTALFDDHPRRRSMASDTLVRTLDGKETPRAVKSVVADGLARAHDPHVANAAGLAASLKLADAIPAMIASQVVGRGNGSQGGALAYILVGQQQAFVSDLEPVVGPSAVAFDPELSVVTEGVVLRVLDAVVVTYRVEVHQALVRLTSDLWGQDTSYLGWDVPKWRQWYTKEFLPEHGPK
ncbi:MAG: hypothetical protein RIB58_02485 [Phycisphaerales bacterium]|jgi:hypothetical protein